MIGAPTASNRGGRVMVATGGGRAMHRELPRGLFVVAIIVAGGGAAPAPAQVGPNAAVRQIEEVIVTARKREETLIAVPLAVTAVTAAQIERRGIKDVEGVIARDPSVNFDLGFSPYDTRIVIRGLSPTRGRPNVATLVDGIDVSSEAIGTAGGSLLINPRLVDIAQIEIVKGPQSALYGRSAFAGAVSYTTLDPGDEVEGSVSLDASDRGQVDVKAALSMPLGETLGVRLNGYAFSDDGVYRNSVTGAKVGGGEGQGASLTAKWQPVDAYSLKFRAEYADDTFDPPPQAVLPFNAVNAIPQVASQCNIGTNASGMAASIGVIRDAGCTITPAITALGLHASAELERLTGNRGVFDDARLPAYRGSVGDAQDQRLTPGFSPDFANSTTNGATAPDFPGSDREVIRLSAVQNFETRVGTFSSLTGYTHSQVSVNFDPDKGHNPASQQTLVTDTETEQFSQELRFTSDFEFPVQVTAGAQYWTELSDQFELNSTLIGRGVNCFALDPFGPAPATALAAGSLVLPFGIRVPAGTCSPPETALTSVSVTSLIDDFQNGRRPTLVRRTVDHTSFYAAVHWDITETFNFTAEGRYVDEDNAVSGPVTDGQNGPGTLFFCGTYGPCSPTATTAAAITGVYPAMGLSPTPVAYYAASPVRTDSYVTPKGTLQWRPNPDTNVYLSYSEGRKPGGYSTIPLGGTGVPLAAGQPDWAQLSFEPERIKVYELGAKWRTEDGRFQVSGAIFQQDFTDKQVSTQILIGTTLVTRVTNASGAELQGVEFAMDWRPSQNLTLGAGVTFFPKYEYTDYRVVSSSAGDISRVGSCVVGYVDTAGFVPLGNDPIPFAPGSTTAFRPLTCQVDRTGNNLEDTPEIAAAVNAGWRQPLASGTTLFVEADANYQSKRFLEDDNSQWVDSYVLANLRIGLEREQWSATLFIDNVADDRTVKSAGTGPAVASSFFRLGLFQFQPAPGVTVPGAFIPGPKFMNNVFADLPRPRTVGLRLNYRF